MSGPKVVRIVTREEIIATCKDALAQLEAEICRWEKVGKRNSLLSDDDILATRRRQADLEAHIAADRFLDLQKQVPDEIAYLQANMAERLNEAASKAANGRLQGRRLAVMAQQTLKRTDIAIGPDLRRELESVIASNGSDKNQAEKALTSALALTLAKAPTRMLSEEQEELAKRHLGNGKVVDLQEWLTANAPQPESVSVKVECLMEELRFAGAGAIVANFAERHRTIQDETSKSRRQMLADTLMLEVGKTLNDVRLKAEQLRILEQRAAPLQNFKSAEAKNLQLKVAVAVAEEDAGSAARLLTQVAEYLDNERKALAAQAQRSAILSALKDLGYEIREGMETAAPKDGRVILRRASNPNMGVAITGAQGAERLQFRPVRFGSADSASDRSKDLDIEKIWCSDFNRLDGKIGAAQGTLKIEQALPVGAVPVLFVDDGPPPNDRRPDVRTPKKTRTMD